MSDNVHFLGAKPVELGEPVPAVIASLEHLLELAKSGELQGFVATGVMSNGDRMTVFSGHIYQNIYSMTGYIEWLKTEYQNRVTNGEHINVSE